MTGDCTPISAPKPRVFERARWRISDLRYHASAGFWQWVLDLALSRHPDARRSNIVAYAEDELRRAGWYDDDAFYGDLVPKAVLRSARLFIIEGHSGMSAGLVNHLTSTVCMFKPLTPLTGEDSEWHEVGPGVFQNRRMSTVFKEDGKAYWLDGRIFREPSGVTFTNRDSRVFIEFPWTPTDPEIVDVSAPTDEQGATP